MTPPRGEDSGRPAGRAERASSDLAAEMVWHAAWARVPSPWREGVYRLDQAPFNQVFTRNANYLRSQKAYDFKPAVSARMGEELAWWLFTVWSEGTRKVEPSMLRWWQRSIDSLAARRGLFAQATRETSVVDLAPAQVVREALRLFYERNSRLPSPGNVRNLESVAEDIHRLLSVRCSTAPWWEADTWSLALDDRIPRREHEPAADRNVQIGSIEPAWLREGVRFWLSQTLISDHYRWTSVCSRAHRMSTYFGRWASERRIEHPAIAPATNRPGESGPTPGSELRAVFMEYLSWLRSPAAASRSAVLSNTAVAGIQSIVQAFYEFMVEHADAAAAATGDPRWRELNADHTRLWAPGNRVSRSRKPRELAWIAAADVSKLLAHLEVLAASTDEVVRVTMPGTDMVRTIRGLGDPQAARAWLLQCLTGRRASEILMLSFDPLTRLPGTEDTIDETSYVARLSYQQTKIDGIDPTILVEQAVVNVIAEQQAWVKQLHPHLTAPAHLFLNPRGNFQALRPRTYRSYLDALRRLDRVVELRDVDGRPLRFSQTHRLRHTKATELLNAGVPVHVVQRYFGHKSPEMTMHYAATLAATAEAEFLRYKKVGADGRVLEIAPRDVLDLAELDRRTDRILPNGICLLPPTSSCDKGNACLPCGSFATDATHLPEHVAQRDRIRQLVDTRQTQFQTRFGTSMPEDNIWLSGRRRELASLEAIIERLNQPDANHPADQAGVSGAGTSSGSTVAVTLVTDGAHAMALHTALKSNLVETNARD